MYRPFNAAQDRELGAQSGAVMRSFGGLQALCLIVLALGVQGVAAAPGEIVLPDGDVIKKLPCRPSKYSSQPVCPAIVLVKPKPAPNSQPKLKPQLKPQLQQTPVVSARVEAAQKPAFSPLSAELLSIARQVELGTVACELGVSVTVTALTNSPGYFHVSGQKFKFQMVPIVSSTGAIRLEDAQAGAVWLQLPEKSMLMSQKRGVRLADACVTPVQAQTASSSAANPSPGLLDEHPPTVSADTSGVLMTSTRAVAQSAE